ncbi:Protein MAM-2 b, partial [Aphelenchoides avenae]
ALACDFSKRGLECLWANPEQSPTKWEAGLGAIDRLKFQSLTQHSSLPIGDFAIARLPRKNLTSLLVSETLRCFHDDSSLLLRFWRSGGAQLSVCVIHSFTYEVIDCQSVSESAMEHVVVDLPHYDTPVRILLKADSFEGEGFVAVDDIVFEGQLCPALAFSDNSGRGTRGPVSLNRPSSSSLLSADQLQSSPDVNVCRLLSCSFDHGLCLYESTRIASSVSMFRSTNRSAQVMLFERGKVAMLESSVFHLNVPARLHFDYSTKKGYAELHVCHDSIRREFDSCYHVNGKNRRPSVDDGVTHDFIEVLPSDTKIYIIAHLGSDSRKAHIVIDNLELTDSEDNRL